MLRHVSDWGERPLILQLGGLEAGLRCMQAHAEEPEVQAEAVRMLRSLCLEDSCRQRLLDYGQAGPEPEIKVAQRVEKGLRGKEVELWTLWGRPREVEEVDEVAAEVFVPPPPPPRGLALLFAALRHPPPALHAAGLALLHRLAGDPQLPAAQGARAALRSARLHPTVKEVQVEAFQLLQRLLEGPSLIHMATAEGVVEQLLEALRSATSAKCRSF